MIERERKYSLTEQDYIRLKSAFESPEILQSNFYFTYPNNTDFMVRLRLKKNRYELTVKLRGNCSDGLFVSDELNACISEKQALIFLNNGISKQKIKEYLDLDIPSDLSYIGRLDTYRSRITYKSIVLELDKNIYKNVTDYELECELSSKQENDLKEFLNLYFPYPPLPSTLPKFNRFLNSH